jgi:TPR repeat protein
MRKALQIAFGVTLLALVGVSGAPGQPLSQPGGPGMVRLAERGNARAQTRLGLMLETGRGLPQDYAEAAYWYRRAAEQGDPDAQYLLGNCFSLGLGVPWDLVHAYKWFNLSASRTREGAEREHRARMRNAIAFTLKEPELEEAQFLATAWRPKPER